MNAIVLSAGALFGLCALFLVVYAVARQIDNFGIVDIAWSFSFGLVALGYGLLGAGWPVRRAIMASMVLLWSFRLGIHLLVRIAHKHPEEDGRYRQLRKDWGRSFRMKMAAFFQLQALSVVLLAIPFLASCSNSGRELKAFEWCGAALWLAAIVGEALADSQLSRFKRTQKNPAAVCDVGLWRFSRHPNYFFEWLVWVAFFLFACASPWGWIGILSPACILYLLLRVTGIPYTEQQSIRTKGDAFRRYQERTSAFVPLPPRFFAK
jgi:steroid 5-alpha reductase family enzyme